MDTVTRMWVGIDRRRDRRLVKQISYKLHRMDNPRLMISQTEISVSRQIQSGGTMDAGIVDYPSGTSSIRAT